MAKTKIKLPDELLLRLSRLGEQTDIIIPKVLQAGGEVVLDKVKANLSTVVGQNTKQNSRSTGELVRSLGLSPAKQKQDASGWDIKIGFTEPRRNKGSSNAKIANILEYGRHGQPPKPFLKPARTATQKTCNAAMATKLQEEIDKL